MKKVPHHIFGGAFVVVGSACTANTIVVQSDSGTSDSGVDAGPNVDATVDVAALDSSDADASDGCDPSQLNGYGVCYPTQDIGTSVRASTSGNRIANFAFTGYAAVDITLVTTGTTKTVHMGDYYDPQQKGVSGIIGGVPIKVIHVDTSAVWCVPCGEETDFITGANYSGANTGGATWATELAPLGVVFVQALDDGPVAGIGATVKDLNAWITHHQSDITSVIDPNNANLGPEMFLANDAGAIPFHMNIDARSMEILSIDVGFDTNGDGAIKTWVAWVNANPPKP